MILKNDWITGDSFGAADENAVATQVNTNTTDIAGKQAADSDLTAIAAIAPANDDVIQRKAGAWTNRTMAQVKTDLVLVKGDVGLGSVDNTADTAKPVSTATQTALDGKQALNSDLTAIAALTPTNDDVVQRKAGAWTNRTITQLKTDLALNNVTNNAQYYAGGTDVLITDGGTGVSTLPSGLLKGAGTGAITAGSAGTDYVAPGGALGTPSSGTLTNTSGLPASGLVASTSQAVGFGTVELGHASDTTLSRSAAGKLAVEGVDVVLLSGAQTLVSKTLTSPVINTPTGIVKGDVGLGNVDNTSNATERAAARTLTNARITKRALISTNDTTFDIDTDLYDYAEDTGLTGAVTVTWSGTPTAGQTLWVVIAGTAARAITWDTDFEAGAVALPTTTTGTQRLDVGFIWNAATSKLRCMASGSA